MPLSDNYDGKEADENDYLHVMERWARVPIGEEFHPGCTGKYRYATRRQAKDSSKVARKRSGIRLGPYLCWHCHGWHLGHRKRRRVEIVAPDE